MFWSLLAEIQYQVAAGGEQDTKVINSVYLC